MSLLTAYLDSSCKLFLREATRSAGEGTDCNRIFGL